MTVQANKETLGFQTEAKQLLHLMIHSLYSNREIFLRELISNASDAADKLRFHAVSDDSLYEGDGELKIRVSFDKEAKTVTVSDNGIGMNRADVIEHLGTIAKSGTAQFMAQLTGDQKKDSHLIGQFGVGFYSAFIVADKVVVTSRKAGDPASEGVRWESEGESEFSVEQIEKPERGTTVELHLKDDALEFADHWRLRSIVKKYSDHIEIPVVMQKQQPAGEEEKDKEPEDEVINTATALWTRSSSDVSDAMYRVVFKNITNELMNESMCRDNEIACWIVHMFS